MKQRAVKAGVLSNPYQYVEAGEVFDRPTRMNWAVPLEADPVPAAPVSSEPEAPAKPTRKRAKAEPVAADSVADDSAEDVI